MSDSSTARSIDAQSTYLFHSNRILTRDEEVSAFERIEEAESRVVNHMLARDRKKSLESVLTVESAETEPNIEFISILKMLLRVDRPLTVTETRLFRLTDSGRAWTMDTYKTQSTSPDAVDLRHLHAIQHALKGKFIALNLKLVIALARKYSNQCSSQTLTDLVQEGNFGLIKAVDRYDCKRGSKFSTYAVWWIRHHLKRTIADKEGVIRVPIHMADAVKSIRRMQNMHFTQTGETMDQDQIQKKAQLSATRTRDLAFYAQPVVSHLDAPIGDDGLTLGDFLADDRPSAIVMINEKKIVEEMDELIEALPPVEKKIMKMRYGLLPESPSPMTLKEVGDAMSLSRERIRQIQNVAQDRIREWLRRRCYRDLVDSLD